MAAELPRPGVEVIQTFSTVSPTVVTPTLVPCVVGVCKQIVPVLTTTATGAQALNTQAQVPLQAVFIADAATGDPVVYTGLDGLSLVLSLDNGAPFTITFAGSSLTPGQVVSEVNAALVAAGITNFVAEVIGLLATATQWRLRSLAASEFETIQVLTGTGTAVASAFGLAIGRLYAGTSYYEQDRLSVNTSSFPDPNKNLAQVVIDPTTVTAYLYLGSGMSLQALMQDRSFLMNGFAVAPVVTGTVDLTTLTYAGSGGSLNALTLIFTFNGASPLTVTFGTGGGAPTTAASVITAINAVINAVATASLSVANHLVITDKMTGLSATILVGAGTANGIVGITGATTTTGLAAAASIDQGNGTAVTPLVKLGTTNLLASASAGVITGTSVISAVADGHTLTLDDGTGAQTVTFSGASTSTLILAQINKLFGVSGGGLLVASINGSTFLQLTSTLLGVESIVSVISGTALTELGLTASTTVRGGPFPAAAGDDLYLNGVFYATISQVNVGGQSSVVKINKQVAINSNLAQSWYIISKNITQSEIQSSKPTPDLLVDGVGNVTVKQDLLRDLTGTPLLSTVARAQIYIAYQGIRQDVTALAASPALLSFSDTTSLGNQLGPISAANPLALGLYFALLNAPGTLVTGVGVDAATPDAPFGTVEAFNRAATFLESFEVYAIAPLTHDPSVGQIFNTHVTVMSSPTNKGERIALYNPSQPSNAPDTLVASGLNGNSLPTPDYFDSGVPNLDALLIANGITGASALLVSQGVYLDVGDGNKYSVSSVTGSQIIVKVSGFQPGDNDDSFYATTTLPSGLIAAPFAVRIRGAALVLTDGTPDKLGIATAYAKQAQTFLNRRFWQIIPDKCAATLGGLSQLIDGFYMAAAIAGMIGQQPPQQSFTNFPMTGFTQVIGSNGYLSESQLNIAAGGGNYIIVQDVAGAPLISRMALTTDLTSIETRTDSITKVVDFTAKFMRTGLKNFIGRFNITQGFLDSLGHIIQGLLGFLADASVLIGSTLNNIVQDTDAPDTVLVQVTLDVPFPCNYIMLTLVV